MEVATDEVRKGEVHAPNDTPWASNIVASARTWMFWPVHERSRKRGETLVAGPQRSRGARRASQDSAAPRLESRLCCARLRHAGRVHDARMARSDGEHCNLHPRNAARKRALLSPLQLTDTNSGLHQLGRTRGAPNLANPQPAATSNPSPSESTTLLENTVAPPRFGPALPWRLSTATSVDDSELQAPSTPNIWVGLTIVPLKTDDRGPLGPP